MLTITLQANLYPSPDSNQDCMDFKSIISSYWIRGAFVQGEGFELACGRQALKTLVLSQVRLPIFAIPALVLHKGIEPLSFDGKSNALATMLMEHLQYRWDSNPYLPDRQSGVPAFELRYFLWELQELNLLSLSTTDLQSAPALHFWRTPTYINPKKVLAFFFTDLSFFFFFFFTDFTFFFTLEISLAT